ncbi:sialate O-acetylesterase [Dysgonomonas sp. 216]|uniref:sialate O-acetylesterase n=1 Tax=Dysgonomonas sp. 216 TaxID=2302934 RepID=UPI0013D8CDF2|nr:sialate O-acetylesterase [Dysgonomonas sp. 216]NDW19782.1 sialate O-acetylesterase [Dysgonomonas sp. 216]
MKRITSLFFFLGVILLVNAQQNMDLYLLIGQSNMAGRGDIDDEPLNLENIYMMDKNDQWVQAHEPIHFDKAAAGAGLAATFAMEVRGQDRVIGLIPCAIGGSRIELWVPEAFDKGTGFMPYDDAIRRTKEALKRGNLKAILWHQGESNSSRNRYNEYEEKFEALLANLSRDLSIDIDTIPVITGELGHFFVTKGSLDDNKGLYINSTHHRLAQKKINRYCVSSAGLTHRGDQTHFDTPSLRELGKRYAEAYKIVKERLSKYIVSDNK